MRCPYCEHEVQPARFCENCGAALPLDEPFAADVPVDPTLQMPMAQTTAPYQDQQWQAQQDPYQQDPYQQAPYQQVPGGTYQQAPGGTYQPPMPPAGQAAYQGATQFRSGQEAVPNTAFVLAIVGLVLAISGIGVVVGIVLCIVALVLNSKNNKSGKPNPHKTSTTVISIIGLVMSALVIVSTIFFGILAVQVYDEMERSGFDPDKIEVNVDEKTGKVTIDEKSSGSSNAGRSSGAVASGPKPSASTDPAQGPSDPRCLDAKNNFTLFAFTELDGQQLKAALEAAGYKWNADMTTWFNDDTNMVYETGLNGDLPLEQFQALAKGGAGTPVIFSTEASGYKTPADALAGLSNDVNIEDQVADRDSAVALVKSISGQRYIVIVTQLVEQGYIASIINEEAANSDVVKTELGLVPGSIDDLWKLLKSDVVD